MAPDLHSNVFICNEASQHDESYKGTERVQKGKANFTLDIIVVIKNERSSQNGLRI
jgi:hypothetical protein